MLELLIGFVVLFVLPPVVVLLLHRLGLLGYAMLRGSSGHRDNDTSPDLESAPGDAGDEGDGGSDD